MTPTQPTAADTTASGRFDAGLAVRREVMGSDFVDRALTRTEHTDSAILQHFVTDKVWGGIWTRPGLDRRSRSLLNIGILIALRAHEELTGHVRGALRNGLTRNEITEAVVHTAGYCGAPAALAAMRVVQEVLDSELGPLADSQNPHAESSQ
jgi:4-carboxymuconolactone decarboxylase